MYVLFFLPQYIMPLSGHVYLFFVVNCMGHAYYSESLFINNAHSTDHSLGHHLGCSPLHLFQMLSACPFYYRMIGSVCLFVCLSVYMYIYVCLSVCLPLFSGMVRPMSLVFCTIVGYRSETKPIDFGINGYIFKVKVMKI